MKEKATIQKRRCSSAAVAADLAQTAKNLGAVGSSNGDEVTISAKDSDFEVINKYSKKFDVQFTVSGTGKKGRRQRMNGTAVYKSLIKRGAI